MLQPSTLEFLAALRENNTKEWFDAHRKAYNGTKADIEHMVQQVLATFSATETDLAVLTPKDCTYRINRDVRFSHDKSPYKTALGAYMARGGKKSPFAGYYIHIEPGNKSFFGGGVYMPEMPNLKKIRQEIAYCFEEFKGIVEADAFKSFLGDVEVEGHKLTKVPAGYEATHPAAEYLKLKSVFTIRKLTDAEITDPTALDTIIKGFEMVMPMVRFFNRALAEE